MTVASGARAAEAFARVALAQIALPSGLYGTAYLEATAGLAIARSIDHREWTAAALSMLGRARLGCGDAAGALRLHEEFREIAEGLGTMLWLGEARENLAEDLIALGRPDEAAPLIDATVSELGELAFYVFRPLTLRAELRLGAGDAREAAAIARAAIALSPALSVWVQEARRVEGEALAVANGPEAAERGAEAGPARWRAALAQARLFADLGRTEERRAAAARALVSLEATAADIEDPQLKRSFEATEPMVRARATAA